MNKERRKSIAKARDMVAEALSLVEVARDDEQDAFDCMPDNLQQSERGDRLEENVQALEEIIGALEGAFDEVEDIWSLSIWFHHR